MILRRRRGGARPGSSPAVPAYDGSGWRKDRPCHPPAEQRRSPITSCIRSSSSGKCLMSFWAQPPALPVSGP